MYLKIIIDIQRAMDALDAVKAVIESDQIGEAAGAFAVSRILSRTLSGRDVDDAPFAPYSDSYARRKGGTVNLASSGEMLGSVDYQAGGASATVTCSSSTATYHEQGTSKMPQRRFMGLSDQDREGLLEAIIDQPLAELLG